MDEKASFDIEEVEHLENGCKYNISISFPMKWGFFEDVHFCVQRGNQVRGVPLKFKEKKNGRAYFETNSPVFLETWAMYKYFFSYKVGGFRRFLKEQNLFGDEAISYEEMYKMSVNFKVPEWAKGATMYHIFVDRFCHGSKEDVKELPRRTIHKDWHEDVVVGPDKDGIWNNDFFCGDIKGIISKLDYISSLGVDIIYLSPIVYSQSTHRYDTSDYEEVDPYAGTFDDLKELCDLAHKRNMKVVLDGVFNHTGNDSKYFNEYKNPIWNDGHGAINDENSPYRAFYKWYYNSSTNRMEPGYWWGFKTLPVCNGESKEWQDYIVGEGGVIDKWFSYGIDGLRLDVADELTDDFISKIRTAVHRNKEDGFIIGEVWKNPMYMGRSYVSSGKGLDSVMNYNFVGALIRYFRYGEVDTLVNKIKEIKSSYPKDVIDSCMNFTSTHDISRGINLFANDGKYFKYNGEWPWNLINEDHNFCRECNLSKEEYEKAKEIYMAYTYALAMMPGIFSVFYGDEVGIQGYGNLLNRKPFPWDNKDEGLLEFFRIIGGIKRRDAFLRTADISLKDVNPNYLVFERFKDDQRGLILVNRSPYEQDIILPKEYRDKEVSYSLKKSDKEHLSPYGGLYIK